MDNKTQTVTIEVPVFEGFEFWDVMTPDIGDWCLYGGRLIQNNFGWDGLAVVYRKVLVWDGVTIDDAIRALKGERVEVRFWNKEGDEKQFGVLLTKLQHSSHPWVVLRKDGLAIHYKHCEVKR